MNSNIDVADHESLAVIDVSRRVKPGMTITCDIRRVAKWLMCIVITLVSLGTIAELIKFHVAPYPDHQLARLVNRFMLSFEPSIPTWYSSTALLCSGVFLGIIALAKQQARDRFRWHWIGMAILFVVFSIDEVVRLHEMINRAMITVSGARDHWFSPSLIVTGLFVLAFFVVYIPFLKDIDRRAASLFVLAGSMYVFGTIVMDTVGSMIVESYGVGSILHTFNQLIEESCELFGIVILLYALLDYIRRCIGQVQLRLV